MRRFIVVLALVAASCSGTDASGSREIEAAPSTSVATITTSSAAPTTTEVGSSATTMPAPDETFVAWMPRGLSPGFGLALEAVSGVSDVGVFRTGTLGITESRTTSGQIVDRPPDGFFIPVEVLVVDDVDLRPYMSDESASAIAGLAGDEVALSELSAQVRRLSVGDTIVFRGGIETRVGAVLADAAVGSTEIIVNSRAVFEKDNSIPRYALLHYEGDTETLERELVGRLPTDSVVRVRRRDASRSDAARAVQPILVVKQRFGEFAVRPRSRGTRFEVDPAWREANIVTVDVPLLGPTQCHREFAEVLTLVMENLIDDGLEDIINQRAFRGCWNPRFIAGTTRLSRHSFGVAADINFGNSLDGGAGSPIHPELLATMAAAGVTSGHTWTSPDPGHFEWFSDDPIVPGG